MVAIRSVRAGLEEFPWPDIFEPRSYSQYLPISTGKIYRQRYRTNHLRLFGIGDGPSRWDRLAPGAVGILVEWKWLNRLRLGLFGGCRFKLVLADTKKFDRVACAVRSCGQRPPVGGKFEIRLIED
jgi:hypothetical protein